MSHSTLLDGQVAIVTGASAGLGREFALALARCGVQVQAAARRRHEIELLAADEPRITSRQCDVTDQDACRNLVEGVVAEQGRIDILVNNAGTVRVEQAEVETPESFRQVVEVNLIAPFTLSHLVSPTMLEQGSGVIVNIASIAGLVGIGRIPQASYAASKGGIVNLTRELAAQWAQFGIRVNAIAPGWFPTNMTKGLFEEQRGRGWMERMTPIGRGGRLSEVTGALLYLVNPANSYTTGVTLPVDGGWTAV